VEEERRRKEERTRRQVKAMGRTNAKEVRHTSILDRD
jgi:hypothetical protein